ERDDEPPAPGPEVPAPESSAPEVAGPDVAGPEVAGPDVAGPEVAGPDVAGPTGAGKPPHPPRGAEESRALWLSALEDEISRATRYGAPLALLLAELDDADRVLAAERDAGATFGRFAQAVRTAVRRQDILACETDTRAWIIARDTARPGAQA